MVESSCAEGGLAWGVTSEDLDTVDASGADRGQRSRAWKRSVDLLVAAGLMVLAGGAALALPDGSTLRLAFVVPILLVAPGYLLLQALIVPARSAATRGRHAVLSLGVSPALLGLLALSTAIVPGGFQEGAILAVVTIGSVVLGAVGFGRRRAKARVLAGDEEDVTQTA